MSITREELAAFADGELDAARAAEVAAAVADDPALQAQVSAHRALKARLGAHFRPIADAPVPEGLAALLRPGQAQAPVTDLAVARAKRERARARWGWITGPALAASLALVMFYPRGGDYARGTLAEALDGQLVATQAADAPTRILLSFRDADGNFCRAFAGETRSGIACHDDKGWRLVFKADGVAARQGEYRTAGTPAADVIEHAQAMAAGPALDAGQEQAARKQGWH